MAQRPRSTRPAHRNPPRRPIPRSPYQPRRRATCGSTVSIWLLLIIACVGVLGKIVYDRMVGDAISAIGETEDVRNRSQSDGPPPPFLQQPFNVLLVGVDARENAPDEGVRSDTLIVVHVDPIEKWASLLSIPRDTAVTIPHFEEAGAQKITLAYSRGYENPTIYDSDARPDDAGQALAAETVSEFLGIDIDYTAQVDHGGFEQLVDAIDGITVDVPHAIMDAEYPTEDFGYMRLLIEPGLQRMDGQTALWYARTRHADSDFGRSQRQQQVLTAALTELRQRGILGKLEAVPGLLSALEESVRTTMPIEDIGTLRGLATLAQEIGTDRVRRFAINPDTVKFDERFDNRFDLHWDPASVRQLAQEFEQRTGAVAGETQDDVPEQATVQVWNGRGIRGLASQITTDLEVQGFTVTEATDSPYDENPHTLILDYAGRPETRNKLAEYFDIDPSYVRDESANKTDAPPGVDIVVLIGEDYTPRLNSQ